ncbi:MAG: lysophospholipid acyltransferase family protein [Jannaschia sp.]
MRNLTYWLQGAALRTLLALVAPFPIATRRRIVGAVTERIVALTPALRARADDNMSFIWPEMADGVRQDLVRRVGRNAGRTLTGIWFSSDFAEEVAPLEAEGPGLELLREARTEGRGAIIVSGHFGQWEAIRHVLRRQGLETGAIYRPNNNPFYEPIFLSGIELGGQPIIPKGTAGMRVMLRHLKSGGFMALLPDQHVRDGAALDFMGQPAATSLSPAELALRYDVPLIPAFAPWGTDRPRVVIEAAIPPSDPQTMMAEYNARLGAWVERHPSQWHWLHLRWKLPRETAPAAVPEHGR